MLHDVPLPNWGNTISTEVTVQIPIQQNQKERKPRTSSVFDQKYPHTSQPGNRPRASRIPLTTSSLIAPAASRQSFPSR